MQSVNIYVSAVLDGGSGFGQTTDTGESVFIPSSIIKALQLREGEYVTAKVKENSNQERAQTVPWFAVAIVRDPVRFTDATKPFITDDDVLKHLSGIGMCTVDEIAEEMGADAGVVQACLNNLFRRDEIVRMPAFTGPSSGAVKVYYVDSLDSLEIAE